MPSRVLVHLPEPEPPQLVDYPPRRPARGEEFPTGWTVADYHLVVGGPRRRDLRIRGVGDPAPRRVANGRPATPVRPRSWSRGAWLPSPKHHQSLPVSLPRADWRNIGRSWAERHSRSRDRGGGALRSDVPQPGATPNRYGRDSPRSGWVVERTGGAPPAAVRAGPQGEQTRAGSLYLSRRILVSLAGRRIPLPRSRGGPRLSRP